MTMSYTNVTRDKSTSTFVRVSPTMDGTDLVLNAKLSKPRIQGQEVPMVSGSLRVSTPRGVDVCGSVCPGSITEAVEIKFNVKQGGDELASMLNEARRVLDLCISEYNFANGLVPPVVATFAV